MLDRVLRGEHNEYRRQRAGLAIDRHLPLLHRFQQRRLSLCGRAIDFVGQQEIGEYRSANQPEFLLSQIENIRPRNIRGHQVWSELNALKITGHSARQRFHQQRFSHAGNALDQRVATGKQRYQSQIDRFVLADNHAAECLS